jgi:hypothetical protein
MERLKKDLEVASQGKDYQFKMSLATLKRQIDGEIKNEIAVPLQLLNSTEVEHPLIEALRNYRIWEERKEYEEGAVLAFENYEKGIDHALDKEYDSVAAWAFASYIEFADDVSHEENLNRGARKAVKFLEETYSGPEAHDGNAGRIIETISEADLRPIDDKVVERLVDFCWTRSDYSGERNNHYSQRKYLRRIKAINNQRDKSLDNIHRGLIESFNSEIELKRDKAPLATAAIIEEAIAECQDFADEEVLNEWRLEKREANREGIAKEMKEVSAKPDEELVSSFEEACDMLVENFAKGCKDESPEVAFAGLLSIPDFIPRPNAKQPRQEEHAKNDMFQTGSFREIFPKRLMKSEGDSVSEEKSDLDVDDGYQVRVELYHGLLLRVLFRLLERDLLQEVHLYILLESIPGASVDDKAFLTDFLRAFFEERHTEAIHLGLPRLEGVAKRQLEEAGIAVTSDKRGEDLPKSLGGLFNLLEDYLEDEYVTFLKYRYTDDIGPEIRNQVAHGGIGYREANFDISASVLIELFRLSMQIDGIDNSRSC